MKERNAFFSNVGLCMKLALVTLLMIGGSNFAWGDELTVYDDATTSDYIIPISGKNLSNTNFKSEFVIPSSELTVMQGTQISKMTFYIKTASSNSWGDARFQVFLKEVDSPSLTALTGTTGATIVYEGTLDATGSTMVINFTSSQFDYVNKNLLVGIYCTNAGTSSTNDVYYYAQSFTTILDYATAAFYTTYAGTRKFIPKTTFEYSIPETYKRPKNLAINSYTSSSATLSWTAGGSYDGETWQIAYSTKEDFDPDTEGIKVPVAGDPYYTLSGLTEGVTYYAYVRSNYSGNYSAWCNNKLEFTPYMDLTINDGSTTSYYEPVYGFKVDNDCKSQVIIPKGSLESMVGRKIAQLTFYASQASVNWGNARFDVYLNEVENTSYASTPVFESWGTKVCSNANISISGNKMIVIFDTPYLYNGGNLMIGFYLTTTGTASISSWYGVSGTNNVAYYYKSGDKYYTSRTGHLPKVTFRALSSTVPVTLGTNGYTTFASPRPLDLTTANLPDGLTAYKASVDRTKVIFTPLDQTVPANTGVLLEGPAGNYDIPVAASGSDISGNEFEVNSTGGTFTGEANTTYFGLIKDSNPLVFGTFDPSTVAIPTNKAYLKVATANARQLTCVFGDDGQTTGISDASHLTDNGERRNDNFFNLNGQRIVKPTKGLYIKNGKKVVVK